MKNKFILASFLVGLILVPGCSKETSKIKEKETSESQKQIEIYEKKIKKLEEENNEYKIRNRTLGEELDSYQKFIEESINYIAEDKILDLAKNEFSYKIEIDDKSIIDNKDIEIDNSNFTITIIEEQSIVSSTIDPLFEKGSLDGEYQNHLEIIGIEPININSTDGTIVTGFIYEFKDVSENTNFKLQLSNELKERLSLSGNIINIHVK